MHAWADQLLPQILMKQLDTLPTQSRHIEHMHEELWLKKNIIDKMTNMRNLTIFPDCIKKGLCLCYHSAYTGESTPTAAFDGSTWHFAFT